MKKQLTAFLLIFALLLSMSGCSTADAVERIDNAGDKVEVKLDAAEDLVEERFESTVESIVETSPAVSIPEPTEVSPEQKTIAPAPEGVPTVPAEVPTVAAEGNRLTKEQAQQIALDYVGLSADQVTRLRTEYELDDRVPQFDVEFRQGNWEYEFEINAEDGKIISFDKDYD